ncbi:serine/threonine-protein kinase, partial [Arenimonas sp.]|uniref:serine/threonine-protein kinase n=1 Tax=Arenimonas sp. TaxID=1872635 RepID=UPI002E31F6A7
MSLKKLGRYEVIRVLGKGAMGVVYEGRDPNLDRRVAIKTVKVENLSEEAAAEYEHRFRTEARSAARLQHPNIVSVYDSDRDGDVAFLVMEYIQGDDLKHHLDRGVRYSLEQSLKIIRDLLSALDYAHKQGIVHRDIKPANLLIEPGGRVKLTDFGVARIQDSGEATRTQGSMVGTLKYMAPEQVQGQKIDSRADLFSAGVVLYQLLTDKRPFDGDNDFSIIHQIIGHNPPTPTSINPKLPPAIDAVVARALAKTREERFATARDFAVALQAAIRRAEDQTVVPPQNPNKKVEPAASRPLTTPGSVPPGGTTPSIGSSTSVTQELELVYWKDVKDSSDAEELQGFLEKFPAGIYADLARRRLRKLSGGDQTVLSQPGMGTSSVFAATQFPDSEATRMRTDVSRPAAPMAAPSGPVGENGTDLRPANWVDEEYTKTIIQPAGAGMPLASPAAPAIAPAAPVAAGAAAIAPPVAASTGTAVPTVTQPAAPAVQPVPVPPPMQPPPAPVARATATPVDDDDASVPPPAKKKLPVAALATVGALAVAGLLALVMGRSTPPESAPVPVAATAPPAAAPRAAPAPAAPPPAPPDLAAPAVVSAPAPAAAPPVAAATPAASAPSPKAAAAAKKAASQPTRTAKAGVAPPPEPAPRPAVATVPARVDPEPPPPRTLPPPVSASASALQAVDQCKDKVFIMRELCLAENCAKPG